MSMPFYVSPEQLMKDKADYARKGIARGRSVVVLAYDKGIAFVAENPQSLRKISEIYDRIAFAAVGMYYEFENLRVAGIRYADLRGYSYDRSDVSARGLANAYAQTLGTVFTQEPKPYEIELVVAEVGETPEQDQIYRLTYDGSVADQHGFVVMGGAQRPGRDGAARTLDPGAHARPGARPGGRDPRRGPERRAHPHPDRQPARGRRPGPATSAAHLPPDRGTVARGPAQHREPSLRRADGGRRPAGSPRRPHRWAAGPGDPRYRPAATGGLRSRHGRADRGPVTVELYDAPVTALGGDPADLRDYEGQVVLVVNTASQCGLTPQYAGLQRLQDRFAGRGFSVLAFPCNQFGHQEPGSAEDIHSFCQDRFGVTFPVFDKVEVNGPQRHPLYASLTEVADEDGVGGDIQWNFEKFLIAPGAGTVRRFRPQVEPESPVSVAAIENALAGRT